MKSIKLMITGMMFFLAITTQGQIKVNLDLGRPPNWGPVGYSKAQYYYLPDVQSYYDVPSSRFIYLRNGSWFRSAALPPQYRGYDLYNGYKVVLTDYKGKTPYTYFKNHKVKYYKGYKGKPQKSIGMRAANPGKGNKKMSYPNGGGKKFDGNGNGHVIGHGNGNGHKNGNGHGNGNGKGKGKD